MSDLVKGYYNELEYKINQNRHMLKCYLAIGSERHYRRVEKTIERLLEERYIISRGLY